MTALIGIANVYQARFFALQQKSYRPPVDRRMIDKYPTFVHHLFPIIQAYLIHLGPENIVPNGNYIRFLSSMFYGLFLSLLFIVELHNWPLVSHLLRPKYYFNPLPIL